MAEDKKKRDRGTWFLVLKQGKVEEYKNVRDLRARVEKLKDGDIVQLIKGREHSIKKRTVETVAIT